MWPSREVYYILNAARVSSAALLPITMHSGRADAAPPPRMLKVITMGCTRSRWDLQTTGSDRGAADRTPPRVSPQIKGDSSTLLSVSLSSPVVVPFSFFSVSFNLPRFNVSSPPPPHPHLHYYALLLPSSSYTPILSQLWRRQRWGATNNLEWPRFCKS